MIGSLVKRISLVAMLKTIVVGNSMTKFQPIKPRMTKPNAPNTSLPSAKSISLKKIKQPSANKPVLIIGTSAAAIGVATCLFLIARYTSEDTTPAIVHFSKHTSAVPKGDNGMKYAIVDGDNKAMMPLKKPNIAADMGPPTIPAITTGTKERLMFAGPICK